MRAKNKRRSATRQRRIQSHTSRDWEIAQASPKWVSLGEIYHHVLGQSPSPEFAKRAISHAWRDGHLALRCEIRKYEPLPNIRLKPGEPAPQIEPQIKSDQQLAPTLQFTEWDWESSRAMGREGKTLSEFVGIQGDRDAVLNRWPASGAAYGRGRRSTSGARAKIDWEQVLIEAAGFIIEKQPQTLAAVVNHVAIWLGPDGEPGETQLKAHLAPLFNHLKRSCSE